MKRHVVDGLVELLAVGRELLDARLALEVPEADGAVVTWETRRNIQKYDVKGASP